MHDVITVLLVVGTAGMFVTGWYCHAWHTKKCLVPYYATEYLPIILLGASFAAFVLDKRLLLVLWLVFLGGYAFAWCCAYVDKEMQSWK